MNTFATALLILFVSLLLFILMGSYKLGKIIKQIEEIDE